MVSGRRINRADFDKIRRHVHATAGCWIWTGPTGRNGYGRITLANGNDTVVHRAVYEYLRGPIPDGLQLDHTCRERLCCNPDHLEPVTNAENTRRQDHANRRKTHCPQGHPYDDANTRIDKRGRRNCRACDRARGSC